jgi:hypothetical protein
MKLLFAVVVLALVGTIIFLVWHIRRRAAERAHAEAERAALFLANLAGTAKPAEPAPHETASAPAPAHAPAPANAPAHSPAPKPASTVAAPHNDLALQKLLFEAAHKAGEANEPALAIQLYARLLARYPATSFAEPARAAAAAQKKKLVKT